MPKLGDFEGLSLNVAFCFPFIFLDFFLLLCFLEKYSRFRNFRELLDFFPSSSAFLAAFFLVCIDDYILSGVDRVLSPPSATYVDVDQFLCFMLFGKFITLYDRYIYDYI